MEGVGGEEGPDRTQNETGLLKTGAGLDELFLCEQLLYLCVCVCVCVCVAPSAAQCSVDPLCPVLACLVPAQPSPFSRILPYCHIPPPWVCRLFSVVAADGLFTTSLVYMPGGSACSSIYLLPNQE